MPHRPRLRKRRSWRHSAVSRSSRTHWSDRDLVRQIKVWQIDCASKLARVVPLCQTGCDAGRRRRCSGGRGRRGRHGTRSTERAAAAARPAPCAPQRRCHGPAAAPTAVTCAQSGRRWRWRWRWWWRWRWRCARMAAAGERCSWLARNRAPATAAAAATRRSVHVPLVRPGVWVRPRPRRPRAVQLETMRAVQARGGERRGCDYRGLSPRWARQRRW